LFIQRRLNPEFFLSLEVLEALPAAKLERTAALLAEAGLSCTIHGVFMDLNPGSFEPLLREATALRFAQVMEAAELLRPRVVVFHPGYDRWRYGEQRAKWLELGLPLWKSVAERAEGIGCRIGVENIFEEEPDTLLELLERTGSPAVGHCFDVGHWNLFSKVGMPEWFELLGKHVVECHVHDNSGAKDDHAPPGEGKIDFGLFLSLVERYAPQAVLTIEAHSLPCLQRSLAYFGR
ncbi:MAG TPA: sugar phosphate isomerase/epimerase family protein, partial [Verrucomicrobiae bacterium]|nr:sugar phosphate isomerase/epimerase family protein [Verrucomicrobiae bacterium]